MTNLYRLTRAERDLVVDFAADFYGWDIRRVGGYVDFRNYRVYVGSNYAGTFRAGPDGDVLLVLDARRPGSATVRLVDVLTGSA